nr:integrase, catalytic region, zinc finger, CCHC-type, peptidase aspartic, catalytic [Tanacetum cinerariifolium]
MSRDLLTVGSTMRIPLLYRGEYSQWVERFMKYLEEKTDGEAMIKSIKNGDQPLPRVTQVSIAGTTSTEQPPLKDKSMWSDPEKRSCDYKNVEIKLKRKIRKRKSSKQNVKQVDNNVSRANSDFVHFLDLDTSNNVRRPKNSGVIWKKKGSCNTFNVGFSAVSVSNLNKNVKRYSRKDLLACNISHLGKTTSASLCNDAMNVSCNPRMCDLLDDNNFFIFDDVNVRISPVSKMPFRKKPRDSMHVHSKSNMIISLPRTVHKWLLKMQPLAEPVSKWFPRIVQICLWIINLGCSKHMTGNRALLTNFVENFLGTVRFGNNDFAVIAGYGDEVIGSMTIKKVYYVEGLGHNLFSVGQFCDKGLEVAFRKSTCFVRNEDGVDLLIGDRASNLYTIALNEVASNSSKCLLAKASSLQSWLWHQRLSHLNFDTINNLVKKNLVQDFEKIDSLFQQTSSLKPYVPNVILEKIIIDLEDEVVNLLEKGKAILEIIESLKSKGFESIENVSSELDNQTKNDCLVIEKECDKQENPKVIAPGMFKLNVLQCVSPISMSKSSCDSKNVEIKLKRKRRKRKSSKQNVKQVDNDVSRANNDFVHFSDLDTFSSVRIPRHRDVIWKKKGSYNTSNVGLSDAIVSNLNKKVKRCSRKDLLACNNSHIGETTSAFVCNDAMNVSCDSRMNDLLDDNNFFIFDDVNIVQICLWIIGSGCSKHMTGNRALLTNFVEKFFGTVRFGNNDFAMIAGYGDE